MFSNKLSHKLHYKESVFVGICLARVFSTTETTNVGTVSLPLSNTPYNRERLSTAPSATQNIEYQYVYDQSKLCSVYKAYPAEGSPWYQQPQFTKDIHDYAKSGDLEGVKKSVLNGTDVNCVKRGEETPLHIAAEHGRLPVVEYLVSQKANIDIQNITKETPLYKAAEHGHLRIVEFLVSQKATIDIQDYLKETPLYKAAEHGHLRIVEILVSQKATIDIQGHLDKTPLHQAAANGHLHVVEYLVSQKADINIKDDYDETPLHKAAQHGHLRIVEFLVSQKATIDILDRLRNTPLHGAAATGHLHVVEYLVSQKADINIKDKNDETPLHKAATYGHLPVVKYLVSQKADIDIQTNKKRTPLHLAAFNDYLPVVEYLVSQKADIDIQDNEENTPLHECVLGRSPNIETATALVKYGADFFARNKKGETPFDIAKRNEHNRILRMFQKELETGLPKEMRYLMNEDVDAFKNALRSGFYYSYLGKIMMVGNEGVGKTAITAILIGKKPSKTRKSTEGIDVHISRTAVDLDERKLIPKVLSVEEVAYRNLAMHKIYGKTSEEFKAVDDDDEQMYPEDEYYSDTVEKQESDEFSPDKTDPIASEPSATQPKLSIVERFLRWLGIKEGDKITADMLKEGTMKAGKKGILTMNLAPVIILDFAGQRVFYSTHQSFLTYRGIYVLTINGSLRLDDEMETESPIPGKYGKPTTREYIEFWVSSILTYSKGRSKMFPKIMVVCTHKDCVPPEKRDEQRTYIYGEITKMFDGTPAMHHLVLHHQIFINAMDPNDPEVEVFKDALVDMMFQQPSWGEKIPKPWIHLEMVINKKVQKGETILHRKQLAEINKENPIQILSDNDLEIFLKVHHSQGDIMYFPLPGLRDHIIIHPAYLVDALKAIITDRRFCVGRRLDMVNTMNSDGILRKDDLEKIWLTMKKFKLHQGHLTRLMCHLDILAEPRTYHQKTEELLPAQFFYVPSLVTKEDLTNYGMQENLCKRALGLSFKFHSTVVPSAVGFRFISCCVEMYDVATYQNKRMLFSGMTVVDINKSLRMLIKIKKQRVDIFLIHEISRFQIISDIATGIRECLNDTLYRISDSYKLSSSGADVDNETVPFHLEFPCFHVDRPCYTQQRQGWVCSYHSDNLGDSLLKWFTDREIEECSNDCQGVSKGALEETVSDLQIAKLVFEMEWASFREMLICLGMKSSEINAIEEDFNTNNTNVKFLCMRKWRMKSRNCTLVDVYHAMEQAGSNMHVLCKVFRDKPLDASCVFQEKEPTDKDLDRIANQVIRESLLLSVQLGIDASYWLHKKEDGDKIIKINRDMLRKWRDEHRGGRKMKELAQACCNVGVNIGFILSDCYER